MRRVALSGILALVAATMLPSVALAVITQVAGPGVGSSNPTAFATNHHVAMTRSGRVLVVHGLHGRGVQLAWKDRGQTTWNTSTTGEVADGVLLDGTNSGDWPSSIVVARDGTGAERAWVVIGRASWFRAEPVRMRVLSDLDNPSGPSVGPEVIVDGASRGDAFADLAIERKPDGTNRGVVVFVQRVDDHLWRLETTWFGQLGTDQPSFTTPHPLFTTSGGRHQATVVPTTAGVSIVARGAHGAVSMFTHDRHRRLNRWLPSAEGVHVMATAKPAATGLADGSVMVALEFKLRRVTVMRFIDGGKKIQTTLTVAGYSMPSIASLKNDAWLVMRRVSDGFIVSRHRSPATGWASAHVEIDSTSGGGYAWPNVLPGAGGKVLRFVVRAARTGTSSEVLEVERVVHVGPDCTRTGTAGHNVLRGTPRHDVLCGGGGRDTLKGLGGNDILIGGPGRDTLFGGPGVDRCSAEAPGHRFSCERKL
jgi:hypothetical protein